MHFVHLLIVSFNNFIKLNFTKFCVIFIVQNYYRWQFTTLNNNRLIKLKITIGKV